VPCARPSQIHAFRGVLMRGGTICTLRISKGDDQMAACGQLGNPEALRQRAPRQPLEADSCNSAALVAAG
jgi:23S rRNA (adenine2503-C2)-methyltransferase